MENTRPFHLAWPVANLQIAEEFYTQQLGCRVGRKTQQWLDLDFFGHQISFHLSISPSKSPNVYSRVDEKQVPIPHFGVILSMDAWQQLANRLQSLQIDFIIEPYIRFKGQAGEQATMFFKDPNGIALEFKAFKDDKQIFAT